MASNGGRRRSSPGSGEGQPPHKVARSSFDGEDDGHSEVVSPGASPSSRSHAWEPDDNFCSSVVQKILPVLVKALTKEKVSRESMVFSDSDSSDGMGEVANVSLPVQGSQLAAPLTHTVRSLLMPVPKLTLGPLLALQEILLVFQ